MTPLFGPKPTPPGIAFGPGFGEHRPGGSRAPSDTGWPMPTWQGGPRQVGAWQVGAWQGGPWPGAGGWPNPPLDPYGQFQPREGIVPTRFATEGFGAFRR